MSVFSQVQDRVLAHRQKDKHQSSAKQNLSYYSCGSEITDRHHNGGISTDKIPFKGSLHTWVLEYSSSQGAFHVQQLQDSIRDNMMAVLNGRPGDYLIVGIFPNQEECHDFSNKLLPYLSKIQQHELSHLTLDDILNGNHFD